MRKVITTLLCAAALFAADAPRRAPGFSLPDIKTQQHDLADYRGKVVVLEFMQTTCPHCAAFTSVLSQIEQKYGNKVAIVSIVNPPDDQSKVSSYISGHQIDYPVLLDCGQVAYSYIEKASFDLPSVFLIDGSGMIRNHWEYSLLTRDIFEGNALMPEVGKLAGGSAAPLQKKK
jgi:peroxiredoxin